MSSPEPYVLADAEERARASKNFEIPPRQARWTLSVGDLAKLIFCTAEPPRGERMWVEVTAVLGGGRYEGALRNAPVTMSIAEGQSVSFGAEHVCDIETRAAIAREKN